MKLRESTQRAEGWLETAIPLAVRALGAKPALDELRVKAAMTPGWRYKEPNGANQDDYLGMLQTSAWFTLDSHAILAAMRGTMPEHDELPPLPFKRMAFDAWNPEDKEARPLFAFSEDEHADDELVYPLHPASGHPVYSVNSIVVFEAEQGLVWDAIADFIRLDTGKHTLFCYHITPGGHTGDYELMLLQWIERYGEEKATEMLWFDKQLGTLIWSCLITAAHMVTATNVVNRRLLPVRHQRREWERSRFGPWEPRIYRVDILDSVADEAGHSDREYHVRWMVRGHYRRSPNGAFKHPADGSPATWVRAYVKGPAGAPWKGRPHHVMGDVV